MAEKVIIGKAELWLGDCREVLPLIKADAVITDPPYGISYSGSSTRNGIDEENSYLSFEDTPEQVKQVCVPVIEWAILNIGRVVMTPGIHCSRLYPKPEAEGVIWYPSGANSGPWGFVTHQPIFFYGKCPFLSSGKGRRPTGFATTEAAEQNGHPCPKPIGQMTWLVNRGSFPNETIFDPFMGSGTTGVASVKIGRKFIGCEIEPRYFDIACSRIEQAQRQVQMFDYE